MKKIIALLLLLAMTIGALYSCTPKDDTQIRVGFLAGPTGIGMAKMINDHGGVEAGGQYNFVKYTAPDKAMKDLKAGNIDLACISTEIAAQFYNSGADIEVLDINCLNSICLLTNDNVTINSIYDLEGKTIYTSMQGTPKLILKALLNAYGVNATISHEVGEGDDVATINSPDQIAPLIVKNQVDIILAPIHLACNALAKPSAKHKITLDIDALWNEKFDTPIAMGCIVARKSFIEEHPVAVENFLREYGESVNFMSNTDNVDSAAEYVVNSTVLPEIEPAKQALVMLAPGIKLIGGDLMKDTLINIYNVYGLDTIGGKLPDDNFYHVNFKK